MSIPYWNLSHLKNGDIIILKETGNVISRHVGYHINNCYCKVNGFFTKAQELMITPLCDQDKILMLPTSQVTILWDYEMADT